MCLHETNITVIPHRSRATQPQTGPGRILGGIDATANTTSLGNR
jgi:hypothetical protein